MKRFEVRFVEVYHVEAETEDHAYDLALAYQDNPSILTSEELGSVEYLHGDDSTKEI